MGQTVPILNHLFYPALILVTVLLPLQLFLFKHKHVLILQFLCGLIYSMLFLTAGYHYAQGVLQVGSHDGVNSLAQRVHTLEHIIYPQVVEWICTQTIQHTDQGVLYRDTLMHEPIQFCKF